MLLHQNFILYSETEFKIGTVLSDYSCAVYSVGQSLTQIITLHQSRAPIVGIKFSSTSGNILYTATNDGHITAYDIRVKEKVVAEFKGEYWFQ